MAPLVRRNQSVYFMQEMGCKCGRHVGHVGGWRGCGEFRGWKKLEARGRIELPIKVLQVLFILFGVVRDEPIYAVSGSFGASSCTASCTADLF